MIGGTLAQRKGFTVIEANQASGAGLVVDATGDAWGRPDGPATNDLCLDGTDRTRPT